ncbi:MAG: hypothetical protein KGM47_17355, partial [Acidobacteriota bacterium]|nr:hypothetical protein [Acidobacteriota bacterium]
AQAEGNSQSVPLIVHPADPKIDNLPLMANLDQGSQVVTLRGTGLERIEQITSKNSAWQLAPATGGGRARKATIRLGPGLNSGETIDAAMSVTGIHTPVNLPGALRVAPPRPAISSVSESFPKSGGVALRAGEIPAGSAVSFALRTDHVEGEPTLAISCSDSSDTKRPLTLQPGNMNGQAQLDYAGEGVLFLSLTPGLVGQSGCALTATLSTASAGASIPKRLGSVIRLPQIEKFSLSDKKIGGSLYEGTLVGQNLQMIAMTGWNPSRGYSVEGIPTPVPGSTDEQTLQITMPWPPPSPSAPVYIWLRGENQGRRTSAVY